LSINIPGISALLFSLAFSISGLSLGYADNEDNSHNSNIILVGKGTGTYTCQNGVNYNNLNLFVWVTKDLTSNISGLGLSQNKTILLAASLQSYTEKPDNAFEISGFIHIDELCGGELAPTTIIINGNCQTEPIKLETSNGSNGKFVGNIICNK
jgi:hypothetical protein